MNNLKIFYFSNDNFYLQIFISNKILFEVIIFISNLNIYHKSNHKIINLKYIS